MRRRLSGPAARGIRGDDLQLEGQVRRAGGVLGQAAAVAGRGEKREAHAAYLRSTERCKGKFKVGTASRC